MKAVFNQKVIADSEEVVELEGNVYFPVDAVAPEYLESSDTRSICPWKGTASYYNVVVEDKVNKDAAWYYPSPMDAALKIKDHIAFWKGVKVLKD